MRIDRLSLTAVVVLAASGCAGDNKENDTTAVAVVAAEGFSDAGPEPSSSDIRWRMDKYRELDGDEENPERLIATASGAPVDSMIVRLEVRTSKDGLLYRHEWPAPAYMKYLGEGSAKDTARVLRETQRQLAMLFADSMFIHGAGPPQDGKTRDPDPEAIRFDLAEHQYRTSKGLNRWSEIQGTEAWNGIDLLSRTIPEARINAIVAETRDKPSFMYYAGGEETYVIAWSPTEQRMVRIAACC